MNSFSEKNLGSLWSRVP